MTEEKTRPEFELLDSFFKQLYANVGISRAFLRIVKNHIDLCEHIAENKREKDSIVNTRSWWTERAELFKMLPEYKPATSVTSLTTVPKQKIRERKFEMTESDRKFLHSLHISPPED